MADDSHQDRGLLVWLRWMWFGFFELVSPLIWLALAFGLAALAVGLWIEVGNERRHASALRDAHALQNFEKELALARLETAEIRRQGDSLRDAVQLARQSLDESRELQRKQGDTLIKELEAARKSLNERLLPESALGLALKQTVNSTLDANTSAVQALSGRLDAIEAVVRQRGRPQRLAIVVSNSTRMKASVLNELAKDLHNRARLSQGLTLHWFEYRGKLNPIGAPGELPTLPDPGPMGGNQSMKGLVPQPLFVGAPDASIARRVLLVVPAECEPPADVKAWNGVVTDVVLVRFVDSSLTHKELIDAESRWRRLAEQAGGVLALVEAGANSALWHRHLEDAVRRLSLSEFPQNSAKIN